MTSREASRILQYYRRDLLEITQEDMAACLSMSLRSYRNTECGKVACKNLHILAAEALLSRKKAGLLIYSARDY